MSKWIIGLFFTAVGLGVASGIITYNLGEAGSAIAEPLNAGAVACAILLNLIFFCADSSCPRCEQREAIDRLQEESDQAMKEAEALFRNDGTEHGR